MDFSDDSCDDVTPMAINRTRCHCPGRRMIWYQLWQRLLPILVLYAKNVAVLSLYHSDTLWIRRGNSTFFVVSQTVPLTFDAVLQNFQDILLEHVANLAAKAPRLLCWKRPDTTADENDTAELYRGSVESTLKHQAEHLRIWTDLSYCS